MAYDLLIEGGTVVDGSGLPGERADIGVTDGIIAAIGDLKGEMAKETIDAEGQIIGGRIEQSLSYEQLEELVERASGSN